MALLRWFRKRLRIIMQGHGKVADGASIRRQARAATRLERFCVLENRSSRVTARLFGPCIEGQPDTSVDDFAVALHYHAPRAMEERRLHDIPDPGERGVGRYTSRPFPASRYVPGLQPHPTRDPTGHSFEPVPRLNRHAPWNPEQWLALDEWLYGVDLFNHFYFLEAHEACEGLLAAVERETPPWLLLQGLIQIAAALLKTHMGVLAGAQVLSAEGLDKLRRAAAVHSTLLGLDLNETVERLARYFAPVARNELPTIGPETPVLRLLVSRR